MRISAAGFAAEPGEPTANPIVAGRGALELRQARDQDRTSA